MSSVPQLLRFALVPHRPVPRQFLLSRGGSRTPQSVQSEPRAQLKYSEPGPPSSQSLSEAKLHVFVQAGRLGLSHRPRRVMVVALGHAVSIIRHMPHEKPASHAGAVRGPQSAQSLPKPHKFDSEPTPPSSQMPSDTELHSLVQTVRRDPQGGPAGGGGEGGDRGLGGDGGREGGEGGRGGGEGGEGGGEGGLG